MPRVSLIRQIALMSYWLYIYNVYKNIRIYGRYYVRAQFYARPSLTTPGSEFNIPPATVTEAMLSYVYNMYIGIPGIIPEWHNTNSRFGTGKRGDTSKKSSRHTLRLGYYHALVLYDFARYRWGWFCYSMPFFGEG